MLNMLKGLWQYRYFVLSSVRNDLVSRFVNSKLGGLWILINPLSQVLIYALVFSNILAARLPGIESKYAYAIYLMAGLLAWNLFNEIITRCISLFLDKGNLIKKVSFPKITLPVIVVGSSLVNNALLFIAMLVIFAILGHKFTVIMLWLIPLTAVVVLLALGIGLILGVMNVFIRDIGQAMTIIIQVWFWFTPIIYPENIIPESYRYILKLNPVYSIIDGYHQVLVYNSAPIIDRSLIVVILGALLLLVFSLFLFRRGSAEIVDVL